VQIARFIALRLLVAAPQVLAVTLITFLLVRLLPGNPAYQLAGPFSTPETLAAMEQRLGLDQPIWQQYLRYLQNLVSGDWGQSWFTARPVAEEMLKRLPATLELVTIAMIFIVAGGIFLGVVVARRPGSKLDRGVSLYGQFAGAFPDFWLGLVLSYVFFYLLGWAPGPSGRLPTLMSAPPSITGFYTIDSLLAGDLPLFFAAVAQLALPVATLVIVYMGGIAKLARTTVQEMLRSDMAQYARISGLRDSTVLCYALKNSLPPILTLVGLTYGFLLGGAVLVETVFSWGGVGQYVVASVGRSDYFPVQAFVLAAAIINIAVYLIVDVIHILIDPRVQP
jgi:peptide/nickel transport system permease protein